MATGRSLAMALLMPIPLALRHGGITSLIRLASNLNCLSPSSTDGAGTTEASDPACVKPVVPACTAAHGVASARHAAFTSALLTTAKKLPAWPSSGEQSACLAHVRAFHHTPPCSLSNSSRDDSNSRTAAPSPSYQDIKDAYKMRKEQQQRDAAAASSSGDPASASPSSSASSSPPPAPPPELPTTDVTYIAPLAKTHRSLKGVSLANTAIALIAAPFILLYADVSYVSRVGLSASMAIFGILTTGALHWLTKPYVHELVYHAGQQLAHHWPLIQPHHPTMHLLTWLYVRAAV